MDGGAGAYPAEIGSDDLFAPRWLPLVQSGLLPRLWKLAGLPAPPPGPCQLTYETVPVRSRDIYIAFVPVSAQGVTTQ